VWQIESAVEEYDHSAESYDEKWDFYVKRTIGITLPLIYKFNKPTKDDWKVLEIVDIGCGTAQMGQILRLSRFVNLHEKPGRGPQSIHYVGVDISKEMLKVARRNCAKLSDFTMDFHQCSADKLPMKDKSADLVISTNSLHYWPNPDCAFREIRRVLRPGGTFVVCDWCHDYLMCRLCGYWLRFLRKPFHKIYRKRELVRLLNSNGFQVEKFVTTKINSWGMMVIRAVLKSTPRA